MELTKYVKQPNVNMALFQPIAIGLCMLIGPIPWGHSGPPLSCVVVVVVGVVVDIDAQAARDSTASDIW